MTSKVSPEEHTNLDIVIEDDGDEDDNIVSDIETEEDLQYNEEYQPVDSEPENKINIKYYDDFVGFASAVETNKGLITKEVYN